MERVVWRSKQALDFSFLMMYAQSRATFYVQVKAIVWHTLQNADLWFIYLSLRIGKFAAKNQRTAGIFVASPEQLSL